MDEEQLTSLKASHHQLLIVKSTKGGGMSNKKWFPASAVELGLVKFEILHDKQYTMAAHEEKR